MCRRDVKHDVNEDPKDWRDKSPYCNCYTFTSGKNITSPITK